LSVLMADDEFETYDSRLLEVMLEGDWVRWNEERKFEKEMEGKREVRIFVVVVEDGRSDSRGPSNSSRSVMRVR
jgi:hypothetical protein